MAPSLLTSPVPAVTKTCIKYVVGLLFRKDGTEVDLIEKLRPAWQRGRLNGIGGKIEEGECADDAMPREFREETGANVVDWRMFCVLRGTAAEVSVFVAHSDIQELASITDERVLWIPVADLHGFQLVDKLSWLIPMALDRNSVSTVVNAPW